MAYWRIKPLQGKYYGTEVERDDGSTFVIWLSGCYEPSDREIAEGWEKDYGMDHTEDAETLRVARVIVDALNASEAQQ